MASPTISPLFSFLLILSLSSLSHSSLTSSPLSPKAALLRYWARKISNNNSRPDFFTSKLSPLSPPAFAAFSSLSAAQLSSNLPSFCSSAHLACPLDASSSSSSLSLRAHNGPSDFKAYANSNFTNYATKGVGLTSAFSNYSDDPYKADSFQRYSRSAVRNNDSFSSYSPAGNLVTTNFTSYSSSATGGTGDFSTYHPNTISPKLTFTNYDTDAKDLNSSFSSYTQGTGGLNSSESFTSYGKGGLGGIDETFASYSNDSNTVSSEFKGYGEDAKGAKDNFTSYAWRTRMPDLRFSNYDANGTGADRSDFTTYNTDGNIGDAKFESYGRKGDGFTGFAKYADNTNAATSEFSGYGEEGKGAGDNFTSYGNNGNDPQQQFRSYGANADGGADSFSSYRNESNVGEDSFASYGKKGINGHSESFANYGLSLNGEIANFTSYGEGSSSDVFDFTTYFNFDDNPKQFMRYENEEEGNKFTFKFYVPWKPTMARRKSGGFVNRGVEPGKFFRERELKKGNVMPMPDIRDKMPARSFLPRSIAAKIPFSAGEVRKTFRLPADTAMGKAVGDTITECERAPSRGETKKCVASAEDMIDFAVSVLGSDVVVRSTENTRGSKGSIMIGDVKGVNGGKITQSVSCHQSLFPYLVYYCHSVPKVRVYEADILTLAGKEKINHGIAICHIDTSDWSAGHGAFLALGSMPGKIEVCHWIFEGDMTWAKAD